MIKLFEDITKDFTEKELNYYIPLLITGLKTKINKINAISTPEIIKKLYIYDCKYEAKPKRLRPERIRMMVRYITVNDLIIGIQGGGKGYYVAEDAEGLDDVIQSMKDRIKAQAVKLKAIKRHQRILRNSEIKQLIK